MEKTHVSEAISKVLMPTKAWGPEAIKHLEDDEGMAFQFTKFRTCNNVDLFLHFSLKISIANVSGPDIQIIKLSQEDKESDSAKGDNTRIDAIKRDFSKMPVSNKSVLVASIMFHIKDKVNTNLLVIFRRLSALS